ncbi:hypothetical protein [Phenylobacterium immobile]|uniref:hypothetical protein n=1 Tax=Phenylobacterium immobile TaxID=21 RepID=UPI000A54FE21|nr:hypothetical protein [Phenylobacterium immobile]
MRPAFAFLAALIAMPAHAGAVRCRLEHGALVAPAAVAGIAGDYIIDTGQAHSILAETQAQDAGFDGAAALGDVLIAGQALAGQTLDIVDLDGRSRDFATPIAGVIGADLLAGFIFDVRFSPCWLALWRPGQAPRFRPTISLSLDWIDGAPAISASVADGPTVRSGGFTLATGLGRAISLSPATVRAPASGQGRLRALSLAGDLFENLDAVIGPPKAALGDLGSPVLARYRLRLDFPARLLHLTPAER